MFYYFMTMLSLQRENTELRGKLANIMYGAQQLNLRLAQVNDTGLTEVCQCPGCFIARRFSELNRGQLLSRLKKSRNTKRCLLKECLEWQCDRLGLTHHTYRYDDSSSNFELDLDSGEDDGWAYLAGRMDCHLVIMDKGEGLWEVYYGRKLAGTRSLADNPETDKLKQLFELLEFGEDFFLVNGVDYFTMADERV